MGLKWLAEGCCGRVWKTLDGASTVAAVLMIRSDSVFRGTAMKGMVTHWNPYAEQQTHLVLLYEPYLLCKLQHM